MALISAVFSLAFMKNSAVNIFSSFNIPDKSVFFEIWGSNVSSAILCLSTCHALKSLFSENAARTQEIVSLLTTET